jgi:hypothetical protein
MNNQSNARRSESPDTYDRAFVRTVLRLNGVSGTPTEDQLSRALQTFERYETTVSQARRQDLDDQSRWLRGRMPEQAAVERAFLFVKFDSVMNATAAQSIALHHWLKGGLVC